MLLVGREQRHELFRRSTRWTCSAKKGHTVDDQPPSSVGRKHDRRQIGNIESRCCQRHADRIGLSASVGRQRRCSCLCGRQGSPGRTVFVGDDFQQSRQAGRNLRLAPRVFPGVDSGSVARNANDPARCRVAISVEVDCLNHADAPQRTGHPIALTNHNPSCVQFRVHGQTLPRLRQRRWLRSS